ncbi:MAG: glycoside hydrolase family 11 protein [Ruminococcus sp.]|nr:glycoside hydrolase family 11 protein [Ruminococcus sp.]
MGKWFRKTLSAITAGLCLLSAVSLPSVIPTAQVYAADYSFKDTADGLYYELWSQNSMGDLEYENTENNGFTMSWTGIEDAFALKGDAFEDNTVFASQIKEYTVTYDEDVDYMGQDSYSGVYGWMLKPDPYNSETPNAYMEFYIVDSWGNWRPHGDKELGSFESNGITYDLYQGMRVTMGCFMSQPTMYIYYSVAHENLAEKTDGTCNIKNTINVADHLKAWSEAGLELGYMYDVGFSVQAYRSSGNAQVNSLEITKEITPEINYGPVFTNSMHDPAELDEEGRSVYIDFETDNDRAGAADETCKASYDTSHSFSGERSMLISADGDEKRTFTYEIDPYDFKGNEMLGGVKLYHNSDKNVKFTFEIMRDTQTNGKYVYDSYSKVIAPDHWGSMDQLLFSLYVDKFTRYYIRISASKPVDFYVDDLYIYDNEQYNEFINSDREPIRGDINNDKSVDMFDVIALRRELLDAGEFSIDPLNDVNGDYKLDISDLVLLTRFVLGQTNSISEPEGNGEYYRGYFNTDVNGANYNLSYYANSERNTKTVIRDNGTYMAQWEEVEYSDINKSQYVDKFDSLCVKYSGEFKADECGDKTNKSSTVMHITAEFGNDDGTFTVYLQEGADDADRLRWIDSPDGMEIVNIGGIEYYVDKQVYDDQLKEVMTDNVLWIYLKDNSFEFGEPCRFDREIDFAEILKFFGKEDYQPGTVSASFSVRNVSGHIDFNELSFNDNSKAK